MKYITLKNIASLALLLFVAYGGYTLHRIEQKLDTMYDLQRRTRMDVLRPDRRAAEVKKIVQEMRVELKTVHLKLDKIRKDVKK